MKATRPSPWYWQGMRKRYAASIPLPPSTARKTRADGTAAGGADWSLSTRSIIRKRDVFVSAMPSNPLDLKPFQSGGEVNGAQDSPEVGVEIVDLCPDDAVAVRWEGGPC